MLWLYYSKVHDALGMDQGQKNGYAIGKVSCFFGWLLLVISSTLLFQGALLFLQRLCATSSLWI